MKKPTSKIKTILRHERGFALVATLSLMILLTMVAVGLLSLSAVSLRSSSQGNAAAEARANARMALMLAIGELQKELGPDSRITAPHDAGATATGGKPRWTAVYDAWELPDDPNAPETPASRNPKFRGWLASGANQATGGPAGAGEDALLAGQSSLARNAAALNQIKVPMLAVTRGTQKGRIAWWSADESVKAKINAGPEDAVASNPLFNSQSAPHAGHQAIELLKNLKWKPGQRPIAVTNGGVNLAAELGNSGIGNMDHDVTVHSAGVLCDVRAGRLKRDISNLLSQPVEDMQNKPLYLADGRMNRFNISESGAVTNGAGIPATPASALNTPGEWGVNLEELHLFHNIHRDLDWSGGNPNLKMKATREQVVSDRYYLYKRPIIDAVQFILSLKAEQFGGTGKYRMVMMLDGMVALANPNDVPIVWPAGLIFPVQLQNVPYGLKWNITTAEGTEKNTNNASTSDFGLFVGRIGGGAVSSAAGFNLAPGESAVFGSTIGSGPQLDLMPGFKPSGGVRINPNASNGWDLKATGLDPTDKIDFTLTKGDQGFQGSYTFYNAWIGDRKTGASGKATGWQTDSCTLSSGGDISSARMNEMLISPIRPSEIKAVSDFLSPQPVMKISFLRNVERDSGSSPPDAFASRPFQLSESAAAWSGYSPSTVDPGLHAYQRLITAEPANFKYETFAAGDDGLYIYHGGGRYLTLGGSINVVRRRIPLAAPLSLGAFENAIASGFTGRFKDAPAIAGDDIPANAMALCGDDVAWPEVSKAIGNSHGTPYLQGDQVYRAGAGNGAATRTATDHSWMSNTALWDSWFLSSIVDGRGQGSNAFQKDARSPREQLEALANSSGKLRNTRYLFHPHRSPSDALKELFDGDTLKKSALNSLAGYLLVDGPFNVNSTSVDAWRALLSSVREQELLVKGGATRKFGMPYGTIGYAQDISTSNDWTGLRDLSEAEVRTLAAAIVDEVKARGPFLSLADFVNRRPNSTEPQQRALGALQGAIDKSGLNTRFAGDKRTVKNADFAALLGSDSITAEPVAARALGTAGHLTQAKLLTAIGSQITVRSDTFIIRSYGDARDASGKIMARAWCEATVQRLPEYIDSADLPEYEDGWPNDSYKLSTTNSRFGRRWEIKSFRWLNSAEVL